MVLGWDLGNALASVSPVVRRRREAEALERSAIEQVATHRLAVMFGDPCREGPARTPAGGAADVATGLTVPPARPPVAEPAAKTANGSPAEMPAAPAPAFAVVARPRPCPVPGVTTVALSGAQRAYAVAPVASSRRRIALPRDGGARQGLARMALVFGAMIGALVIALAGAATISRWAPPPGGDGAVAGIVAAGPTASPVGPALGQASTAQPTVDPSWIEPAARRIFEPSQAGAGSSRPPLPHPLAPRRRRPRPLRAPGWPRLAALPGRPSRRPPARRLAPPSHRVRGRARPHGRRPGRLPRRSLSSFRLRCQRPRRRLRRRPFRRLRSHPLRRLRRPPFRHRAWLRSPRPHRPTRRRRRPERRPSRGP